MNVTIFGTGYVGLVTGACLADVGNRVMCIDIDEEKIAGLNRGQIPIFEPGLESLVVNNHRNGRLSFSTDAASGIQHGEVIMIAVGTPPDEDGSADLQHVLAVARSIGEHMTDQRKIVVDKSTVPVGTADKVTQTISEALEQRGEACEFTVVSNPEFLKEGAALEDCRKPDRIVIGTDQDWALETMKRLYAPFNRNHERIIHMDVRSAELTKYAANALLATKISFINEMANIALKVGADIEKVRVGIGSDPRIGYHFIYPGAGYGGSCFPKDVQALIRTGQINDYESRILNAVEAVNADQKTVPFEMLKHHFGASLKGKTIALWGLSFKPNTDDMREAPSRVLMEALWAEGAEVRAYDPEAMAETRRLYGQRADLVLCTSAEEAAKGADALVVITEWKAFWSPQWRRLKDSMKQAVIIDGRNIYDPEQVKAAGFTYYGIGRT